MELNFLLFPAPKRKDEAKEGQEHLTWIPVTDHRDKQYHTKLAKTLKEYFVGQNPKQGQLGVATKIKSKAVVNSRLNEVDSTKAGDDNFGPMDSQQKKMGPKPSFNRILSINASRNDSPSAADRDMNYRAIHRDQMSEFANHEKQADRYFVNGGLSQMTQTTGQVKVTHVRKSFEMTAKDKAEIRAQLTTSNFIRGDAGVDINEGFKRNKSRSISKNCRDNRDKQQNVVIQKSLKSSILGIPMSATMCNKFKVPTVLSNKFATTGGEPRKPDLFVRLTSSRPGVHLDTLKPEPDTFRGPWIPSNPISAESNLNFPEAVENVHQNLDDSVHMSAYENINKVKQTPVYATKSNGLKFIMKKKNSLCVNPGPSYHTRNMPSAEEVANEYEGIKKRSIHTQHLSQAPSHMVPCLYLKSSTDKDKPAFFNCTPRDPSKVLMIYLHGNGEDLFDTFYVCRLFSLGLRVARCLSV